MSKLNRMAQRWEGAWDEDDLEQQQQYQSQQQGQEEDDHLNDEEYNRQRQLQQREAVAHFETTIENFKLTLKDGIGMLLWEPSRECLILIFY